MNQNKLEKEVRFLKIYAGVATLIAAILLVTAFTVGKNKKFDEIDVERINIVEKDGKLKMVISNKERQHPGTMDGKYYKEREGQRTAGMIFFSSKGDEIGGIGFDGETGEGQGGSLTFDKFRGDQTIQLTHQEDNDGNYFAGLRINDQNMPLPDFLTRLDAINKLPTPEERGKAMREFRGGNEATVSRMIIGKSRDKTSLITMNDGKGKPRIKISVANDGTPNLDFLDENGKMIYSLPENAMVKK
jgi:hypothetical protein